MNRPCCDPCKGGTVIFPAGKTYLTTAFQFESSNTVMHVPLGARVLFDDNRELYQENYEFFVGDLERAKRFSESVI